MTNIEKWREEIYPKNEWVEECEKEAYYLANRRELKQIADFWLSKIDTILEERNELIKGSLKKYFEEHNHDEICLNGALEALHLPILK